MYRQVCQGISLYKRIAFIVYTYVSATYGVNTYIPILNEKTQWERYSEAVIDHNIGIICPL